VTAAWQADAFREGDFFVERETALARLRHDEQQALAEAQAGGEDHQAIRSRYRAMRGALHATYADVGRMAAYLGYDAVHAARENYCIILNRSAVRVQRENLR
jgi:hypothetical protein